MESVYRELVKIDGNEKGQLTFYKPVGCDKCGGRGFKGRCGPHQLLIATDKLKKLVHEHRRLAEMLAQCPEDGMHTLKQDRMEQCLIGLTPMQGLRTVL